MFFFITERGNKSKIQEHFNRTISILVGHDADPNIKNHSNSDVADLLTEFNNAELSMLVANRMHNNKYRNLPGNFNSYMVIKDKDGMKNIVDIKSNSVPSVINTGIDSSKNRFQRDKPSVKPRIYSDTVSDKPQRDKSLNASVFQGRAPTLNNEIIDNTKVTNKKMSLLKVNLPGKSITETTDIVTTPKKDVLKKLMLDSDILELKIDLCKKELETIDDNSEATDSLKTIKRKSPLVKPGPSPKKQKPVADKCDDTTRVTLRSVRKAVKDRT